MLLTLYIIISLITLFILKVNKDIKISLLTSNIFGDEISNVNKNLLIILLVILSPYTLYEIINILIKGDTFGDMTNYENYRKLKLKIKIKNMKWLLTIVILGLFGFYVAKPITEKTISYYNKSINLEASYNKLLNERLATIDKMEKIVYQELQISKINDSSFRKNISIVMEPRKDQPHLFMKWVKEVNPNENYENVSMLYNKVINSIESERSNLLRVENAMQNIDYQYTMLHKEIPSSWYLFYMSKKSLGYEPISTSLNKEVNKTGIDNRIEL